MRVVNALRRFCLAVRQKESSVFRESFDYIPVMTAEGVSPDRLQ